MYDIKIGPNSYFIGAGSKSSKGPYTIIKKIKPKRMPDGLFHEIDQLFQTPKSKSVKKKRRITHKNTNMPMQIDKKTHMNQKQMSKILKCLQHLAGNYDQWVEVGMILKNEYGDEGLPMWIEWSRKDNGYSGEPDSMYQKHWDSFESGGLGVGTLMFHLKAHSQADYFFCVNSQALDVSHASLAKIFFDLYGSAFFKQDREIFHWNGVFWESADDLFTHEIGFTSCDFWRNLSQMYSKEGANSSDESTKAKADKMVEVITSVKKMCQSASGAAGIEKFVRSLLPQPKHLNLAPHLFVFNNTIFDLKKCEELTNCEQTKEMYMTVSCGYDYIKPSQKESTTVAALIQSIFPDESERNCYLKVLASGLIGETLQKFVIANGYGRNGKGCLNDFFLHTLGEYGICSNVAVLCEKRRSGPNPELANLENKRFVIFREHESDQKLNIATIKDITGGNKLSARQCNSNKTEMDICGTLVLEANDGPTLNSDGSKACDRERLLDVPFRCTFNGKNGNPAPNPLFVSTEFREEHKSALFEFIRFE